MQFLGALLLLGTSKHLPGKAHAIPMSNNAPGKQVWPNVPRLSGFGSKAVLRLTQSGPSTAHAKHRIYKGPAKLG
jgi:hypothetical protein